MGNSLQEKNSNNSLPYMDWLMWELLPIPQSNGKVDRFQSTIKKECIRNKALLDQYHAKIIIGSYITF